MLHNLLRAAAVAAFVAGSLLAPVPALAGNGDTARVAHGDLNLASAAGRATLDRRVARAAQRVCGVADERQVALQMKARRCADEARIAARPAIETAHRAAADRQVAARD